VKKTFKIVGGILLILLLVAVIAWFGFLKPSPPPISEEDRAQITLMPLPSELKVGKGLFILSENLGHAFEALRTPRLERAVSRFYRDLSLIAEMTIRGGDHKVLTIICTGEESEYPALDDDESYTLRVTKEKIELSAPSETGILYGLQSLLQLASCKGRQWVFPVVRLEDQPRYSWRGVMIDACRHWIPKEVILRNLDAMAALKMNVFHWHLTEYQGFRVESKLFPKLHEMGSHGDYYSQDDILAVVEYAADRGIRVVPEFDLPGHSTSWFVGYPELASAPGPYTLDTTFGVLAPVMDPTREEVYDFLDQFLGEIKKLFPDQYVHIGGDEVKATHWNENPAIQEFMDENSLEDSHQLQAHFNIRLQRILAHHGKKMMGWDEILHPDLPREGIAVQTWRDQSSLWESARKGNKAVLSAGYYLDYKQPASFHYQVDPKVIPGAVSIEIDSNQWKGWDCTLDLSDMTMEGALYLFGEGEDLRGIMQFMDGSLGFEEVEVDGTHLTFFVTTNFGQLDFEVDLWEDSISGTAKLSFFTLSLNGYRSGGSGMTGGDSLPEFRKIDPLNPEQEANLLGGEACMWSEMVDGNTIESRIWPRAAAIGEKLWSPEVLTGDVNDMYRRLMIQDDRLELFGLNHRRYSDLILQKIVQPEYLEPFKVLVGVLQEDKFFNRMEIYHPELYSTTPLNRVVDAALPESYKVYRFGQDVDQWLESADEPALLRITQALDFWSSNHEKLAPVFETSERLKEVEAHSNYLSRLADLGIEALSDPSSLKGKEEEIETFISSTTEAHGGTILPLGAHVKKLVDSALKN